MYTVAESPSAKAEYDDRKWPKPKVWPNVGICTTAPVRAPSRSRISVDHYVVAIGLVVSAPQIRDFAVPLGWLVFCSFLSSHNKAAAYTPERMFTQNTSKDVVKGNKMPFLGPVDCILNLDPEISEKPPFWGPILTDSFLQPKILTWGCSNTNYS